MTKQMNSSEEQVTTMEMMAHAAQTCFDMCKETWHDSMALPRKKKKEVRKNIRKGVAGVQDQMLDCGMMVNTYGKKGVLKPIRTHKKLLRVILKNT